MIGDACQHVREPGARVNIVELCRGDQRIHGRGPFSAAVTAGEQPALAAKRHTTKRPFGGVVGQADPSIIEG
jgi:hypothetical protein